MLEQNLITKFAYMFFLKFFFNLFDLDQRNHEYKKARFVYLFCFCFWFI